MEHAFFTLNEEIIRQIFGIPQGSPLSPALSQCVLIYYEHQFMSSIDDHTHFMGLRYIDDVRLIVLASSHSPTDIQKAENQITAFINNLPKSLIVEPEPNINNGFRFLESYITFDYRSLKIAYFSKNFHGTIFPTDLDTYPFQVYTASYMANAEDDIKNNIRNRLEAIERYSSNQYAIHIGMVSSFGDFYCSKFPRKIILTTLYSYIHTKSPRKHDWLPSYAVYHDHYPHDVHIPKP